MAANKEPGVRRRAVGEPLGEGPALTPGRWGGGGGG